jgi:hypothetical protein
MNLPLNQWRIEVENRFAISLAALQEAALDRIRCWAFGFRDRAIRIQMLIQHVYATISRLGNDWRFALSIIIDAIIVRYRL